jgi:hypothetical protein
MGKNQREGQGYMYPGREVVFGNKKYFHIFYHHIVNFLRQQIRFAKSKLLIGCTEVYYFLVFRACECMRNA